MPALITLVNETDKKICPHSPYVTLRKPRDSGSREFSDTQLPEWGPRSLFSSSSTQYNPGAQISEKSTTWLQSRDRHWECWVRPMFGAQKLDRNHVLSASNAVWELVSGFNFHCLSEGSFDQGLHFFTSPKWLEATTGHYHCLCVSSGLAVTLEVYLH